MFSQTYTSYTCYNSRCCENNAPCVSILYYGLVIFISVGKPTLDLPKMMAQKLDAVKGLTSGIAYLFKNNKVRSS